MTCLDDGVPYLVESIRGYLTGTATGSGRSRSKRMNRIESNLNLLRAIATGGEEAPRPQRKHQTSDEIVDTKHAALNEWPCRMVQHAPCPFFPVQKCVFGAGYLIGASLRPGYS